MPEGFSPFMHPQWDGAVEIRGLTAASTHAAWEGGATACVVRAREGGRDTIWLNGLFRGFAVYNVLAGKVAIG